MTPAPAGPDGVGDAGRNAVPAGRDDTTVACRAAVLRLGDLIVPVDIDPALASHGRTDWYPVTITLREWNETVLLHEVIHALIGTAPGNPLPPDDPQHEALVRRITEGLTAHGVTVPAYTEAPPGPTLGRDDTACRESVTGTGDVSPPPPAPGRDEGNTRTEADRELREQIARRLAAAGGDGAFDHADDPERWEADAADRDYWYSLADAVMEPVDAWVAAHTAEVAALRVLAESWIGFDDSHHYGDAVLKIVGGN